MLLAQPEVSKDSLKALDSFLRLTKEPANFDAIYDIDEVLNQSCISTIAIEHLKSYPDVADIVRERYLAPVPDLNVLLTYSKDSLGYHFAVHLTVNGFDPEFYRKRIVKDDISYISLRRSQTHDIHHVVTGFGTDLADEIGLQAFQLAQMKSPLAIVLLSSSIVYSLQNSELLNRIMIRLHQGWQMGLQTKPFFAQKWEEHWEKPLAEWRSQLNVNPVQPLPSY